MYGGSPSSVTDTGKIFYSFFPRSSGKLWVLHTITSHTSWYLITVNAQVSKYNTPSLNITRVFFFRADGKEVGMR